MPLAAHHCGPLWANRFKLFPKPGNLYSKAGDNTHYPITMLSDSQTFIFASNSLTDTSLTSHRHTVYRLETSKRGIFGFRHLTTRIYRHQDSLLIGAIELHSVTSDTVLVFKADGSRRDIRPHTSVFSKYVGLE